MSAPLRIHLNSHVVCPCCWNRFPPDQILWIATHPELVGDPKLGQHEQIRFLPTQFDLQGNAIDRLGSTCNDHACPRCHLKVPRASIETKPMFVSIAGTPSCGKSYFLASMTYQMRQHMPSEFKLGFSDADPACNQILNDYEEQQFFNADRDTPVRLRKTEEQGDDYVSSMIDGHLVQFASPFLFTLRPIEGHPNEKNRQAVSRLLCLYDNAGESFAPGRDAVSNPVTRHLGQAAAIFFCFDPMQDPRLRTLLAGKTDDMQVVEESVTARQEIVFHEVVERFRRLTGLPQSEKTERPVVVIVTKFDGWKSLLPDLELTRPFKTRSDGLSAVDLTQIRDISNKVRALLYKVSPDLVTSAEAFSQNVWFIPVSATGRSPERDATTGITGVRPRDVAPVWCDIPLALVLAKYGQGVIPFVDNA
ncbi:hypothetical protein [Rosistilla oblonga]|uniref:hypothetical protein n=1 Tax=Rosistilla oblonga TaxID=2527990 RepID=UPI003A988248